MYPKVCAIVLIVLAISPLTAPFQAVGTAKAATAVSFANDDDDPGSAIGPLVTKQGRLTLSIATPLALSLGNVPSLSVPSSSVFSFDTSRDAAHRASVLRV